MAMEEYLYRAPPGWKTTTNRNLVPTQLLVEPAGAASEMAPSLQYRARAYRNTEPAQIPPNACGAMRARRGESVVEKARTWYDAEKQEVLGMWRRLRGFGDAVRGFPTLIVIGILTALPLGGCVLFPHSDDLWGAAFDVECSGETAWVCASSSVIAVDVADRSKPVALGSIEFPEIAREIAVDGNVACLAGGSAGLRVLDISDVCQPREIASLALPGWSARVDVDSGRVLVLGERRLFVCDLSDHRSPKLLATHDFSRKVLRIQVAGNRAYIQAYASIEIFDVSSPSKLSRIGSYEPPKVSYQRIGGFHVEGNRLHITDKDSYRLIDVTDPQNPVEIGACLIPGGGDPVNPDEVFGSKGRAFVINLIGSNESILVIDLTHPDRPAVLGSCRVGGQAHAHVSDIEVSGDTAFVSVALGGVLLVDVTDPANPTELTRFHTSSLFDLYVD